MIRFARSQSPSAINKHVLDKAAINTAINKPADAKTKNRRARADYNAYMKAYMADRRARSPGKSKRQSDQRSAKATEYRFLYHTPRWRRLAKAQLKAHPLCANCERGGLVAPAAICDHVDPHRGDEAKFWSGPFESLCNTCHSSEKQRIENGNGPQAVDADGWPLTQSNVKTARRR